ncbi:hypothetical protein C1645_820286 [Glomus cerebriforme]|uniref:HMG box domain-containing protein n=1 Tax=Glomus cerebriforme TaxID=658196 RepID=A0A397TCL4_9GLOM|nr:hypothetical protein C1645_820286 [Glomus cerebriforme]
MQNQQQQQKTLPPNNTSDTSAAIVQPPPTPPSTANDTPTPNSIIDLTELTPSCNIPSQTRSNYDPSESAKLNGNNSGSTTMPINDIAYDGAEKDILCNNTKRNLRKRKVINSNNDSEKGEKEKIEERNSKSRRKRTGGIKNKAKPKNPKTPYSFFAKANRNEFNKKYPNASGKDINLSLGKAWRKLNDDERKPYIKMAQDEIEEYNIIMNEYNKLHQNVDNEEKADINDVSPKPFADFRSLLGSPISFGPFEANIETNYEISSQSDSMNIEEACIPKEIIASESPLNMKEEATSSTIANNMNTSQRPQQPQQLQQSQPVEEFSGLPHNNMSASFLCEEQNNLVPMQQPYQSLQHSQQNPQSNDAQVDLQTSQRQFQNNPYYHYNMKIINSQVNQPQQNQFIKTQKESQMQEGISQVQQNQNFQQQQPMYPMVPPASSHMQQSIPFDHKLYPINCHPAQPYMPQMQQIYPSTPPQPMIPQMSYNQLHLQQMMCQMQPPHQMWQTPSFMPTQTNHQMMPLQLSTRHNQMQYNQQMRCCHEMSPFNNTMMGVPPPYQMQYDQMSPMMNDKQFFYRQQQMDMYQQYHHPIPQNYQMN